MKERILSVLDSIKFLEKYKIPVAKYGFARNENQAIEISKKFGFPLVIKAVSKKIVHKTDVGALVLNIKNENDLVRAFKRMKKKFRKIDGILVQAMINGREIIIGGKKDPQFNHVIMFGLGGIFVEIFGDVSFRVVPVDENDVQQMLEETKGYKTLIGYRGKRYDINSVKQILLKVSKMLEKNPKIKELDINPLIVLSKGAFAVDARIILDD